MRFHIVLPALLIAGIFIPAEVDARPDTRSMTCKKLQAFVESKGEVVMNTGPRTYKKFVYHRGFCSYNQNLRSAWVQAKDGECALRECGGRRTGKNSD